MEFSLVSTVFNEIARIEPTISDIENQTLKPSEIIITDAGSNDGTYERLLKWSEISSIPIKILQEKGCNVARGRNIAIQSSKYQLIASTDFGCRFHPDWLKSIIEPFENTYIEVVGGAFTVDENGLKTKAAKADYILQKGYPIILVDFFSVSSRSIAYKKYVWEKIGGYPEWLTLAADDTIFWKIIKKQGFKYFLVDKPYVTWLRHSTNKGFAREAFRYGLGDGESRINFKNFISHIIETLCRYLLLFLLILLIIFLLISKFSLYIIVSHIISIVVTSIGLRSYKNAYLNWKFLKQKNFSISIFLASLWQLELSRIAYIKGYISGYYSTKPKIIEGRALLSKILKP